MTSAAFVTSFLPSAPLTSRIAATRDRALLHAPARKYELAGVHMTAADGDKGRIRTKLAAFALAALLAFPNQGAFAATVGGVDGALLPTTELVAARSGGRVGGSSFRSAPSRGSPSRSYGGSGYRGYRGGYGGGSLAPVMPIMPMYFSPFGFMGGGGSGLGVLLVAGAAVAVLPLLRGAVFGSNDDGDYEGGGGPRSCAVVTVKLGLLASAVEVRDKLDALARVADTNTPGGLARVLSETAVALLRSKEYWVCGAADVDVVRGSGEARFNETSVRERSKIREETLSNVGGLRMSAEKSVAKGAAPEEFVVVTLVVAADSALAQKVPRRVEDVQDLRGAVGALGAVTAAELQAVEVIWAPQQKGDTLTRSEMLLDHPELRQL